MTAHLEEGPPSLKDTSSCSIFYQAVQKGSTKVGSTSALLVQKLSWESCDWLRCISALKIQWPLVASPIFGIHIRSFGFLGVWDGGGWVIES
jgi:hypothetical protein